MVSLLRLRPVGSAPPPGPVNVPQAATPPVPSSFAGRGSGVPRACPEEDHGLPPPNRPRSNGPESGPQSQDAVRLSILIIAHDRKEYLHRAVRSALSQSAPGLPFEIVVVKNFPDPWVDALDGVPPVRCILLGRGSVGYYIATGIAACRGEVISFLDDDDAFVPSKVRLVSAAFYQDPQLVYLHDATIPLKEDGSTVHSVFRLGEGTHRLDSSYPVTSEVIRRVAARSLVNNLSAVSVRAATVAARHADTLRIEGATDYFMFYVATASRGSIRFDPNRLTLYYIHPSAMRPADSSMGMCAALAKLANAQIGVHRYGIIDHQPPPVRRLAAALIAEWELVRSLAMERPRRESVFKFVQFVRTSSRLRTNFVLLAVPLLAAALIRPRFGTHLLTAGRQLISN